MWLTGQFRDGSDFNVERRTLAMAPALSALSRQRHLADGRAFVRDDPGYNCAGLTFANRRGRYGDDPPAAPRLIFPDESGYMSHFDQHVREALSADGYRQVPRSRAAIGDLVTYIVDGHIEHIAEVVRVERGNAGSAIWVVSKFGPYGEYVHTIDNASEECGRPDTIWTLVT